MARAAACGCSASTRSRRPPPRVAATPHALVSPGRLLSAAGLRRSPRSLSDRAALEAPECTATDRAGPADLAWVAWAGSDPSSDPANDLRQWRATIERHESYDELILWFEHDLFDQLNLIQLLTWIRDYLPAAKPVSLICIGSFPGRPDFKGLGELTPDELASLLETRQPVSDPHYEVARRAWRAFREPTPEALDDLRQDDTSALPYLAPAITRFFQEYPWTTDGLSRTERRLLELANGDGIALWTAFPRMHDGEEVYFSGGRHERRAKRRCPRRHS